MSTLTRVNNDDEVTTTWTDARGHSFPCDEKRRMLLKMLQITGVNYSVFD